MNASVSDTISGRKARTRKMVMSANERRRVDGLREGAWILLVYYIHRADVICR